jgi:hypothetical protein
MQLDNLKKCIDEFGMEEIAIFVAALQKQGSRHLLNEFDAKTVQAVESIVLTIASPIGAYYASEGRSAGKYPPVQSIRDYVKSHNIQYRDKLGRYIKDNSTAFLISRKIATLGTKAHASHFLNAWKITDEFKSDAMQAYILDVRTELQAMVDKYSNS